MSKKVLLLAPALAFGIAVAPGQTTSVPAIPTGARVFYAGTTLYPSIQSAVTASCALSSALVIVPYSALPSDTIAQVSGCSGTIIVDKRPTFDTFYTTTGTAYTVQYSSPTVTGFTDTGNASINGSLGVVGPVTLNGGFLNGTYDGNPTFIGLPTFTNTGNYRFLGPISTYGNNNRPSENTSVQGGGLAWNFSGHFGETDLITEYINPTATASAMEFYQNTPTGYQSLLRLDRGGSLYPVYGASLPHVIPNTGLQSFSVPACTYTSSVVGQGCTQLVTLPVPEPDTNYQIMCLPVQTNGPTHCNNAFTKTTGNFRTGVVSDTSTPNGQGTLDIIVIHN